MTFFVPTAWASQRRHGQVPSRDPAESAGIMKMVSQPAPPFDVDRLFERPVMTPHAAVSDLGLSKADESSWAAFIGDVVGGARYEPAVRQQVAERLLLEAWDPSLRRVVLQRAAQLFRDTGMRKSKPGPGPSKPGTRARVITAAELKERLVKAGPYIGPRGGKWADPQHKIPWDMTHQEAHEGRRAEEKITTSNEHARQVIMRVSRRHGWKPMSKKGTRFEAGSSRLSVLKRGGKWWVEIGPILDPSEAPRGTYQGTVARMIQSPSGQRSSPTYANAARIAGRWMEKNSRQNEVIPKGPTSRGAAETLGALPLGARVQVGAMTYVKVLPSETDISGLGRSIPVWKRPNRPRSMGVSETILAQMAGEHGTKVLSKAGGEGSRGGKVVGHTAAGRPLYEGDKKEGASPSQAVQMIRNAMKDTSPASVRGAMIAVTSAGREDAALRPQLKEVVDQFAKMPMPKASLKLLKQASKILSKAEGGLYHRRVPKTGGGYKYYYDPKSYRESKGAHHSGSDMRTQAMGSDVMKAATDAGHEGCDAQAMRRLAKKYGRAELADHLKSSCKRGKLVYKGKRFYLGKGE